MCCVEGPVCVDGFSTAMEGKVAALFCEAVCWGVVEVCVEVFNEGVTSITGLDDGVEVLLVEFIS
jgi:hypothetical protein